MSDWLEIRIATEAELLGLCELSGDDEVRLQPDLWKRFVESHVMAGPHFAAYYRGRLVGGGGLDIVREGVANAWAVIDGGFGRPDAGTPPTVEQLEYLAKVVWTFRQLRDILCRRFGIRKIRAYSRRGFGASQRLLRACGFEKLSRRSAGRFYYIYRSG